MCKIYSYLLCIGLVITFLGCASSKSTIQSPQTQTELKKSNESVVIYGKTILLDEVLKSQYVNSFDAKYQFYPKNKSVKVKNKKTGYFVNYESDNRPEYYITLEKPMMIKSIQYIADYAFAHNPVDGVFKSVNAVVGTPFSLLGKALGSDAPLLPSVAVFGAFQDNGKRYHGEFHEFNIDQSDNIMINNPFGSKQVQKIAVVIAKSWMPSTYTVTKTMPWNPGKIHIEAIDMSDFYGILNHTLSSNNDKEENEDIVFTILKNNERLFKELKKNKDKYSLPTVSFFNLPNDVNLEYAKKNKYKIFQEGIYKNKSGKYVKLNLNESIFNSTEKVEVKVTKLDVDNEKAQYNKQDQRNKSKYIDFSDGI